MLRRNVLIFHQAALGDFVLTWPIALAVARILSQARIIYVTSESKGRLAEAVLRLDFTDAEQGWHTLLKPDVSFEQTAANVQRSLLSASTAIVYRGSQNPMLAESLRRLQPQIRVIDIATMSTPSEHIVDTLVGQTKTWAPLHAAAQQILGGIRQRGLSITRQPTLDVLIHPGSGGRGKRWPLERFIELAQRLQQSARSVQFVLGEVEIEQFSPMEREALSAAAPTHEIHNPLVLLQTIATAKVFCGNDSGPSHLAAIVGTPTIAIFGPTDPVVWSPIGPHVQTIRGAPIESVSVDQVFAAIQSAH